MPTNILQVNATEQIPIVPYSGHCSRALGFMAIPELFLGLGRTSPWANDSQGNPESNINFTPPVPDKTATTVDELIAMKRIDRRVLVEPDVNGTIQYRNTNWTQVTEAQAIANGSRWVLVEATIVYNLFPMQAYRQIGLFSRVDRAAGVPVSQDILLPTEIASTGLLEVLDNRKVTTHQSDMRGVFSFIIEF